MNKPYMALQPTEVASPDAASRIYSARLASEEVSEGGEAAAIETAVAESISMGRLIDEKVMADKELD